MWTGNFAVRTFDRFVVASLFITAVIMDRMNIGSSEPIILNQQGFRWLRKTSHSLCGILPGTSYWQLSAYSGFPLASARVLSFSLLLRMSWVLTRFNLTGKHLPDILTIPGALPPDEPWSPNSTWRCRAGAFHCN